jgi:hypothetical protein
LTGSSGRRHDRNIRDFGLRYWPFQEALESGKPDELVAREDTVPGQRAAAVADGRDA